MRCIASRTRVSPTFSAEQVLFNTEDVGKNITLVSAETQSTRYAFRGNWPIYACCRGKFTNKELDESKGPHSKEGMSELIIAGNNRSIKTGVFYRAYAVNILPDRIDNHNREKDGNNMFNLGNFNWGSRQFQKGPCDDR